MRNRIFLISFSSLSLSFALTRTITIAIAISTIATFLTWISQRRLQKKKSWELFSVLPEIIDHLISGIQSGLSLSESLGNLHERGPAISKTYFLNFRTMLREGSGFEEAISSLQSEFELRAADQLFEALVFAKTLGGSELLAMLRQLGDFTRQDLALRREIAAKQGWIRNSAHLSAAAPWILLVLLSAQPSTSAAFTTPQGVSILAFGVIATAVAYMWMGQLSHMPEPQRIFGSKL